jgi:hypothetical protein
VRRLIVLLATTAIVIGGAITASAEHGSAVDGVWRATDSDGSQMQVTITEHLGNTGLFTVEFIDSRATGACSPAARMKAVTTVAEFGPRTDGPTSALFAYFSDIRCFGNSTPTLTDGFHYEWDVIVDNEVMEDTFGNVWFHVRG